MLFIKLILLLLSVYLIYSCTNPMDCYEKAIQLLENDRVEMRSMIQQLKYEINVLNEKNTKERRNEEDDKRFTI